MVADVATVKEEEPRASYPHFLRSVRDRGILLMVRGVDWLYPESKQHKSGVVLLLRPTHHGVIVPKIRVALALADDVDFVSHRSLT